MKWLRLFSLILAASFAASAAPARAELINYYVGVDGRPTFPSGTYAGQANPNHGRLTFLRFNDLEVSDPATSHYHAIGVYTYTGPADAPVVQNTSSNNRIPEGFTNYAPLNLHPGSGMFAGKRISGISDSSPQSQDHYDRLQMRSHQDLAGAASGSVENYLYSSSGERWKDPLGPNTQVALELVSITPGLQIATSEGTPILESVGARHLIGTGDAWSFTPVFWTDESAAPGTYSVAIKLVDLLAGGRNESGVFNLDFQVPEPSSAALLGIGTLFFVRRRSVR